MRAPHHAALCLLAAFAAGCTDEPDTRDIVIDAEIARRVRDAALEAGPLPDAGVPVGDDAGGPPPVVDAAPPPCADGETRPCPVGCGVQTCQAAAWGACDQSGVLERCNGADDDCDGNIDEAFANLGFGCNLQVDGCNVEGLTVCAADEQGTECSPVADVGPAPEICDGLDNDCDNDVDEDFPGQFCCTEDVHCPPGQTCTAGECSGGGPGPGPGPGGGDLDPALSCAFAVPMPDFGRYEADTLLALPGMGGSCGGDGGEQVFAFNLPEDTQVVLRTDASDYDTVLHVRTDCLNAGSEIACDDDGGQGTRSRVAFRAQAGQDYFVVLDSFFIGGQGVLDFFPADQEPDCFADADCPGRGRCQEGACVVVPAVNCDQAVAVEPGRHQGSTVGREDELEASCGVPTGAEIVYRLQLERPAEVTVDLSGSSFDTILSVRTACEDLATELECDDDGGDGSTSQISFAAEADTAYYLVVDGYSGASGDVVLDIAADFGCVEDAECPEGFGCVAGRCTPPGPCEAAPLVEPGQHRGSTADAEDGQNASCANASGGEAIYRVRFDAAGRITLDTSDSAFDTVLSVRTACDDPAAELVCDDDGGVGTRSHAEFQAEAGVEYFVIVDGYNGGRGEYVLDIAGPPAPPADLAVCEQEADCEAGRCLRGVCVPADPPACMGATPAEGPGPFAGDTAGGVDGHQPSCSLGSTAPDAVYAFVSPVDADLIVGTEGSAFDTVLYVLAADCATELACDDDGGPGTTSRVQFAATAGALYYIVVDGYRANAGAFTLTIQ